MLELKMFERYKYKNATKGFFNPASSTVISLNELEDIFRGRVLNPNKLENPKGQDDYAFMVIGVSSKSPLNSWAGQIWGANCYDNAEECALWYGRFSCELDSKIFLPREKTVITLSHRVPAYYTQEVYTDCSESALRRIAESKSRSENLGPASSLVRTLVSDMGVIELRSCLETNCSRQFLSKDTLVLN